MPTVNAAAIRKAIESHQQERLDSKLAEIRERVLGNLREAIEETASLADAHQRIAECYGALRDRLSSRVEEGGERSGEQLVDPGIRRLIEANAGIVEAASLLLSTNEDADLRLHAEMSRLIRVGAASLEDDDVVSSLRTALASAEAAERKEALRAREQEEWADLPEYHGAGSRSRSNCLHCGAALHDSSKAFCSVHCKDVHQAVFGVREGESSAEDDDA